MNLSRSFERFAVAAAQAAWPLIRKYNTAFEGRSIQPRWAPAPLLKARERTVPQLGWPRQTDSLCPKCVKETREAILSGKEDLSLLVEGKPGEIKANVVERDGRILMEKSCPKHGDIVDVMAIDP